MDDEQLSVRLSAWRAMPGELDTGGYLGYPHPLDAKLDALGRLYLDATLDQREQLAAIALPSELDRGMALQITANLLAYIRRCGRRMRDAHDVELLRLGIAAAMLAGERADPRDLAIALVFLRAGASRSGISASRAWHALDEALPEAVPGASRDVVSHSAACDARRVILGVFRSDEATLARIVAYHVGTG